MLAEVDCPESSRPHGVWYDDVSGPILKRLVIQASDEPFNTDYSTSESRHEQFPFPSLDLSSCCFNLSCR
jgi:hypothetical protein